MIFDATSAAKEYIVMMTLAAEVFLDVNVFLKHLFKSFLPLQSCLAKYKGVIRTLLNI